MAKAPFTVAQGRARGLSTQRMRAADLSRPLRGVRRAAGDSSGEAGEWFDEAADDLADRCAAVALILTDGAFFCHLTAARLWPLPLPPFAMTIGQPVHVGNRPPCHPPRRAGVIGHQISDPRAAFVVRNGHRLLDGGSLFCQLSTVLSRDDLAAVGDSLVLTPRVQAAADERPWVTLAQLQDRVEVFRGRGKTRAAEALDLLRPGAESRPESLLRLAIVRDGMPEPELNGEVVDEDGVRIGWVDLLYRAYRTIVEYDGDQHRVDTSQYDKDVHRLEALSTVGWRVVRVTKRDLFGDRTACLARIRRALLAGGWRP